MANDWVHLFNEKYNGAGFGFDGALPPQAIPERQKNQKWREWNMDVLERIGTRQYLDNLRFEDFYRMIEGKMSKQELADTIPELREVAKFLDDVHLPTEIKHYDIVGQVVRTLIGELSNFDDSFRVAAVDEVSSNEYERLKTDMLKKYLQERIDVEIKYRLMKQGINPEGIDVKDPQEREQIMQFLEKKRDEMTPKSIEETMRNGWRSVIVEWAAHTYEADKKRFYFQELERETAKDYFGTGRFFVHWHVGYDYYKPERWSPIETFFDKTPNTKYPQDGEYVGRIRFMTGSQIVVRYGDKLTSNQKRALLNIMDSDNKKNKNKKGDKRFHTGLLGMWNISYNPQDAFADYRALRTIEDITGVPMATKKVETDDGGVIEVPWFLPTYEDGKLNLGMIAGVTNYLDNIRQDLFTVVEAYWRSYKRVGYLAYEDEDGVLITDFVTEDILKDFIEEKGIKTLRNVTLEQFQTDPQPNTITWDYIPEIWHGYKINGMFLDEPIYFGIEPLEYQIKGDSNIFDLKLPVAGYVGQSPIAKMLPYQVAYNIVMNQIMSFLEKELGMFFIFDINFLPSEYKNMGDTFETLRELYSVVRDTSLFPVDASKQNLKGGGIFNQFAAQAIDFSAMFQSRIQLAEYFKGKALEQIGVNPQRLGEVDKYMTAEGIKVSQTASFAQTYELFDTYFNAKLKFIEMHLNIAQWAQGDGKDITVFYTKSDGSQVYLKYQDPFFQLRKVGILPVHDAKSMKKLEEFRRLILQLNTIGSDELTLAKIFKADTFSEILNAAREARMNRERAQLQKLEHERQMLIEKMEKEREDMLLKWKLNEISKERDRQTKLKVAEITEMGFIASKTEDTELMDNALKQNEQILKRNKTEKQLQIEEEKLRMMKEKQDRDYELQLKKLNAKIAEIKARLKISEDNKYIAQVNKP